jgi:CubicO group peptidase (beta-lactamase class C family)
MRNTTVITIILILLVLMIPILDWAQERPNGPVDPKEFGTFIDGIMTAHMKSYKIAGAAVVVVKDGEIFWEKGYGYSNIEKKKSVKPSETIFRTGSTAKLITWTALMQMVEQGKLDLNKDINEYLSDFKIPETYFEPITLTNLLTHTPGFEDIFCGHAVRRIEEEMPLGEFLKKYMPTRVRPPGKTIAYSNYGAALAGYIIELETGIPFENYIQKHIFKPLGMKNSTFNQKLPPQLKSRLSEAYSFKNGQFKKKDILLFKGLQPAGTMSSTAIDMGKFMIAHLQKGRYGENRILQEKTVDLMHSKLYSGDPRSNGMAHGFWEFNYNNLRLIEHGGDTFYFHSLLTLIPEKGFGVYVCYNSLNSEGAKCRIELLHSILDRYYPGSETQEQKGIKVTSERINELGGYYAPTRSAYSNFEKVGILFSTDRMSSLGKGKLLFKGKQWIEVESNIFREIGGQDRLVFKKDNKGNIVEVTRSRLPFLNYYKLKWYQAPPFHISILIFCTIIFLSTIHVGLSALIRKICKKKK